ncbi:MAG: hypothetical protein V7776_09480 [Halopseudomonas aestusnigri]
MQLVTEACTFNFHLKLACLQSKLYDFDVEILLASKFKGYLPDSFYCRLYRKDLSEYIQYFQNHYHQLIATDGWYESPEFIPSLGMDFTLQCHEGEIENIANGDFAITILINCGSTSEDTANTYFGLRTNLDTLNMRDFCDDLAKLSSLTESDFGDLACKLC